MIRSMLPLQCKHLLFEFGTYHLDENGRSSIFQQGNDGIFTDLESAHTNHAKIHMGETLYGYVCRGKYSFGEVMVYLIKTDDDFSYGNINGDLNMNSKTRSFSLSKVETFSHRQTSTKLNRTWKVALSIYEVCIPSLR